MSTVVLQLQRSYDEVRRHSMALAEPLSAEDQGVQSMPDASPTKWHLAHTTWFFETIVCKPHLPRYRSFDERYAYLFNSYYEVLGPRHARPQRGLLTRPSLQEVHAYRRHVDESISALISRADDQTLATIEPLITLGLHHEQQHQELIVTDIVHALSCNPIMPPYRPGASNARPVAGRARPLEWLRQPGGVVRIGHEGRGFAFDNEGPRHEYLLRPYEIANRLVTCGEYAAFIEDGGYARAQLWLSDGWAAVQREGWSAPIYWVRGNETGHCMPKEQDGAGNWRVFGLSGLNALDPDAPVSNLSFYEAAAYAEWAGARLPTEFEWEAAFDAPGIEQMTGHVWQWTRSSYDPYPGFRPLTGVAAEYNGKFMVGQQVLRGGSIATPPGHTRRTYRNFFPPAARWQFSGVRLVRDN